MQQQVADAVRAKGPVPDDPNDAWAEAMDLVQEASVAEDPRAFSLGMLVAAYGVAEAFGFDLDLEFHRGLRGGSPH